MFKSKCISLIAFILAMQFIPTGDAQLFDDPTESLESVDLPEPAGAEESSVFPDDPNPKSLGFNNPSAAPITNPDAFGLHQWSDVGSC